MIRRFLEMFGWHRRPTTAPDPPPDPLPPHERSAVEAARREGAVTHGAVQRARSAQDRFWAEVDHADAVFLGRDKR